MASAATFSATYFDGPTAVLKVEPVRFQGAQVLRHLTRLFADGHAQTPAQGFITARKDYQRKLTKCDARCRALGTTTFLTDFAALDSA